MTLAAAPILAYNEVPEAVEIEISRCWATFKAAPDDRKSTALQNAAAALFAMCKVSATVHPECETAVEQEVYRELDGMAAAAYIEPGEAEQIYGKARRQGASGKATPAARVVDQHTGNIAEPPPVTSPHDCGVVPATIDGRPASIVPAMLITPSQWPQEAPPPVDWLVAGRIRAAM
jgi:hypothetical protein